MKRTLLKLLALCCTVVLLVGTVAAGTLADNPQAHVVLVEWDDENNLEGFRPDSLKLELGDQTVELNEDNGWVGSADGDAAATWAVQTDPEQYDKEQTDDSITVIKYKHTVVRQTVSVQAVWEDDEDRNGVRPEKVQVQLIANDKPYGPPLTLKKEDGYKGEWKDLPSFINKEEAKYRVEAVETPEFYKPTNGTNTVTFTLQTGTLVINETIAGVPADADTSSLEIKVSGPDSTMPQTLTYDQFTDGKYTFDNLLPGAYLVEEPNVDDVFTNYYLVPAESNIIDALYLNANETGTLDLTTTWTDTIPDRERNEHPEDSYGDLVFEIYGPDETMKDGPIVVTYDDFTDGKYALDNLKIGSYVVVERNAGTLVKYYTLMADSKTGITLNVKPDDDPASDKLYNHYRPAYTPVPQPDRIDIPVTKIWDDNDNYDGNRPSSITVHLYADGVEIDSMKLTAENGWTGVFMDLPKYRVKYIEIVYSISEDPVDLYLTRIDGMTLTNIYQPELKHETVRKIWDDDNNAAGIRPAEVVMRLMHKDTVVERITLSDENGWTATVNDLPAIVNGEPAVYSWLEEDVNGYISNVTRIDTVTTFTNTLYEKPTAGVDVQINHVGDCFD